ncbi:unnamed protein product [Cuscuta campestris]|uniref:Myb-like domain-containing protein n=1 Tax=Cuscuta campestris TaxID=132261 RepID=A0A484MAZ0_9ASTE|nr:unnamed protein product [Cuscuta campestris]
MEDHYGMADLRQFMSNTSFFTSLPPPQQQPSSADVLLTHHHYDMVLAPMGAAAAAPHRPTTGLHHEFFADSSTNATTASGGVASSGGGAGFSGLELETTGVGGGGAVGFDGSGSGRWPRQETLTLLEIRSRLDSKFKEANHKGPLWDEVSRIMSEEHGYRRTGKKCREKFENLYKYYKKTKDGKAGRQDGKHYRFFRQLEALYGNNGSDHQTNNHNGSDYMMTQNHHHQTDSGGNPNFYASKPLAADDSLSLSKCSYFGSTSSGEEEEEEEEEDAAGDSAGENERKRKGMRRRRRWKLKVKEFIDEKMRKLIEKQDEWLERMMSGIEEKEQERMAREEEWRKQEVDRMEREQRFWANERAWIEARDAALLEALHKLGGNNNNNNNNDKAPAVPAAGDVAQFHDQNWATPAAAGDSSTHHHHHEISKLIQLRANMESRFQQHIGCSDDALWEEIAAKMSYMGYDSNAAASMCRDKWLTINNYFLNKGNFKKRKENNISSGDCFNYNLFHNNAVAGSFPAADHHQPTNDNNLPNSLRFLMGDNSNNAENMWEGYELKHQSRGAE